MKTFFWKSKRNFFWRKRSQSDFSILLFCQTHWSLSRKQRCRNFCARIFRDFARIFDKLLHHCWSVAEVGTALRLIADGSAFAITCRKTCIAQVYLIKSQSFFGVSSILVDGGTEILEIRHRKFYNGKQETQTNYQLPVTFRWCKTVFWQLLGSVLKWQKILKSWPSATIFVWQIPFGNFVDCMVPCMRSGHSCVCAEHSHFCVMLPGSLFSHCLLRFEGSCKGWQCACVVRDVWAYIFHGLFKKSAPDFQKAQLLKNIMLMRLSSISVKKRVSLQSSGSEFCWFVKQILAISIQKICVHEMQTVCRPAVPKLFWARPKSECVEHFATQASNSVWKK